MRSPIRLWLAERAELIVLGVTLVATASLVFWWTILLRGEMRNNEILERALLEREQGLTPQQVAERQADIATHHDRRNVMLVGESTLLALMLSGSLVVLFLLGQRRKQQREDMEKLLQFTSHEFKTPVAGVKGLLQSLAIGSIPEAQRAELLRLGQIECDRLEHLAARRAANEAAFKALSGNSLARGIGWRDIEVVRADDRPTLALHGRAADRAAELGVTNIWVSLTHTATTAGAVVVLDATSPPNSV